MPSWLASKFSCKSHFFVKNRNQGANGNKTIKQTTGMVNLAFRDLDFGTLRLSLHATVCSGKQSLNHCLAFKIPAIHSL